MMPFYSHFRHTLTWVALESLTYYGLLSLHQIVLFKFTSPEIYGVIGTTYAISYLCIYFLIAAFDKALAPFFSRFSQNKKSLGALFWIQIAPTYLIATLILGLLYALKPYLAPKFHYLDFISDGLFIILGVKIIIEMTRKGFKAFLNLTFQSHIAAAAEIIAMLIYIVTVWTLFMITGTITLAKVFVPLICAISISTMIMAWHVYKWYRRLPDTQEVADKNTHIQFAKSRIATMGLHLNRLFFTTEFLVPFFAYKFGLPIAGLLKLASKIVSTFSIIIRRVFETSSNVMLANVRQCSLEDRVDMFSFITTWINQVLYACIIFFIINHNYLFTVNESVLFQVAIAPIAYAYLFLSLIDSVFIAYEQFYVAQEKAHYLLGLNFLSLIAFIIGSFTFITISPIHLLILLGIIRLGACMLLGSYSYISWRIKPSLQIYPSALIGATAISIMFFILFR